MLHGLGNYTLMRDIKITELFKQLLKSSIEVGRITDQYKEIPPLSKVKIEMSYSQKNKVGGGFEKIIVLGAKKEDLTTKSHKYESDFSNILEEKTDSNLITTDTNSLYSSSEFISTPIYLELAGVFLNILSIHYDVSNDETIPDYFRNEIISIKLGFNVLIEVNIGLKLDILELNSEEANNKQHSIELIFQNSKKVPNKS